VKNSVHDAEIALAEARSTYERSRDLTVKGLISQQDDLESETRFKRAQAVYDAAVEKYKIVEESGVPIALAAGGNDSAPERDLAHGRRRHPPSGRAGRQRSPRAGPRSTAGPRS